MTGCVATRRVAWEPMHSCDRLPLDGRRAAVAVPLRLWRPFQTGGRRMVSFDVVIVAVESPAEGYVGLGEVARSPLLPPEALHDICAVAKAVDLDAAPRSLVESQAQAAVRMAATDLHWQRRHESLAAAHGVGRDAVPIMMTIGVMGRDELDVALDAAKGDPGPCAVKVKVPRGPISDVVAYLDGVLAVVRQALPGSPIVVDPNATWSSDDFVEALRVLQQHDVEFVEEPLTSEEGFEAHRLAARRAGAAPTLVADERCLVWGLERLATAFGGINVKAGHVGGPAAARELLVAASDLGLVTMIGCNGESALGLAGTWTAAAEAGYVDLDSARMIENDPTSGVRYVGNELLAPPNQPGHGGRVDVTALLSVATGPPVGDARVWSSAGLVENRG